MSSWPEHHRSADIGDELAASSGCCKRAHAIYKYSALTSHWPFGRRSTDSADELAASTWLLPAGACQIPDALPGRQQAPGAPREPPRRAAGAAPAAPGALQGQSARRLGADMRGSDAAPRGCKAAGRGRGSGGVKTLGGCNLGSGGTLGVQARGAGRAFGTQESGAGLTRGGRAWGWARGATRALGRRRLQSCRCSASGG